jgi:hypothetical protein
LVLRHAALVIRRGKEMAVAVHGHLDGTVARKGHDLFDAKALLDPETDREVPEIMPAHI